MYHLFIALCPHILNIVEMNLYQVLNIIYPSTFCGPVSVYYFKLFKMLSAFFMLVYMVIYIDPK